jgi:predicted secreted protein
MISADENSNGREVVLHKDDVLKISLSANASTGFHWTVFRKPEFLRESEGESAESPKGPPGRAGARHFYFEAVAPGSGELEMEYRRSWEHASRPARTFKLRVRVQE